MRNVLVIGYGNSLRGDDGAGLEVVAAVAARHWPGVRTLAVHQLTPELAETVADAEQVIFADAFPAADGEQVTVFPLEPAPAVMPSPHLGDPRALLALTLAVYDRCPAAWWVLVPGSHFEVGESISAQAAAGVAQALLAIERLVCGT